MGNAKGSITIIAPLSGPLVDLTTVPDPVFAQKMVGDGISIDPTSNILYAPCAGTISQIHSSCHAVTIATAEGVEIMMHIGVDTVSLKGKGFTPKVKEGDTVKAKDALIEFEMDYVAVNAKSLLTQIVVTNSERVSFQVNSGVVTAGNDTIMTLTLVDESATSTFNSGDFGSENSAPMVIANPVGLHARPSAVLSTAAKKFSSSIEIICGSHKANAKSTTAIMKMEIGNGQTVILSAQGPDAKEAIQELSDLICNGLGEDVISSDASAEVFLEAQDETQPLSGDLNRVMGIAASPGIAIGTLFKLEKEVLIVEEYGSSYITEEKMVLEKSIERSIKLIESLIKESDSKESEIFEAHIELLRDPELLDIAESELSKGKSAGYAWQVAYTQQATALQSLKSELLAARANDMIDVGESTLNIILGRDSKDLEIPENTILVADDLTPSQTATLDRTKVLGFCTLQGGSSSHVAILARSLAIPAIAGIEARIMDSANGTSIILDGSKGEVELNPTDERIKAVRVELIEFEAKLTEDKSNSDKPATTTDGHTVMVVGNAGGLPEVEDCVVNGGEGIGLMRSEFLFQNRASAPTEEEQEEVYGAMASALGNDRPIVIRTLDVGGDKPLPYLPIPKEENPFLGERGIRVCLNRPEILRMQFRAILKASAKGTIEIMFPMISTLAEFKKAKEILKEEADAMNVAMPKTGIMVEVPVVAAMAEQFAKEVDFFSVGTNDLAQYTMAVDRGHPKLAALADGLTPGLLKLIKMAADGAHAHGITISVCGGIASDAHAVPILIGLGIDKLSATVPAIPAVKAQIRDLSLADCKTLAEQALTQESAADVRTLVQSMCNTLK
ncbi:MAG: phosphoenolpyruvate--protein phosphotransferase [Fibrobacterales bacterium]